METSFSLDLKGGKLFKGENNMRADITQRNMVYELVMFLSINPKTNYQISFYFTDVMVKGLPQHIYRLALELFIFPTLIRCEAKSIERKVP